MKENLEAIDLAPNQMNMILNRRVEGMSNDQVFKFLFFYLLINISILLHLFFSPPIISQGSLPFTIKVYNSSFRRFALDFTDLHYFHDFFVLSLLFQQDPNRIELEKKVNISFHASFVSMGKHRDPVVLPSQELTVYFPNGQLNSSEVKLFSKEHINFDSVHIHIYIRGDEYSPLLGEFQWDFGEPAHSIIQSFIRVLLFVFSIVVTLKLYYSDFTFSTGHITMKLMFCLDVANTLACNPFWFLTYFTDSRILRITDSALMMLLIVSSVYVSVVVLLIGDLKNRDISNTWLLCRAVPFILAYIVFLSSSFYSSVQLHNNPLTTSDGLWQVFAYLKITIYILSILGLVGGAWIFQSEFPQEKVLYLGFSIIFLASLIITEFCSTIQVSLSVSRIVQIYSFVTVSIFTVFFNYANWPTADITIMQKIGARDVGAIADIE